MGTEYRRQSFWAQNRWALPLLLVVIIALIVAGAILIPKLKSSNATATSTPTAQPAAAVATATPKTAAVTATPGSGTPTAASGNATPSGTASNAGATATPANGQGAATPLPNATPIPTEQGKTLGEITRPQNQVTTIQHGADAGNSQYTFYLDPRQVVQNTLEQEGFPKGSFQIVSPATPSPSPTPFTDTSGRPTIKFLVKYQGRQYQVAVSQPGTRGPKGVWLIVTVLPPGYY